MFLRSGVIVNYPPISFRPTRVATHKASVPIFSKKWMEQNILDCQTGFNTACAANVPLKNRKIKKDTA